MLRNQVSPVQLIFTDNPFLLFKSQGNPLGPAKVVVMMYFFEFLLSSSFGSKMIKDSYASELGISRQILVDTCKYLWGVTSVAHWWTSRTFPFTSCLTNLQITGLGPSLSRLVDTPCAIDPCLVRNISSHLSVFFSNWILWEVWVLGYRFRVGFWLHKQLYHNCLRTPTWKLLRRGIFFVTFILFNFCNFLLSSVFLPNF